MTAFSILLFSCNNKRTEKEKQLVSDPASMNGYVSKNIQSLLANAEADKGKIDDSLQLRFLPVLQYYYSQNEYAPVWSSSEKWQQPADSLVAYLKDAALEGLFAEDYQFSQINNFKRNKILKFKKLFKFVIILQKM